MGSTIINKYLKEMSSEEKPLVQVLPINFKEFKKNPVIAMLFLCLIAISVLYVRSEKKNQQQDEERKGTIQSCINKTDRLATEVSFLTEQVRRSDSALADVRATLRVLKEVRAIQ